MRINRDLLLYLPYAEFSEVGHAESFVAGDPALPSFTCMEPLDAAFRSLRGRTSE